MHKLPKVGQRPWNKSNIFLMAGFICITLMATSCTGGPKGGDTSSDPQKRAGTVNSIRVVDVKGEVAFNRGDAWIPAASGMQLALSDTLTTEVSSETDLDVDDNQHVLVGERVRMVIEDLLKTVDQSKVARFRLDTGALYVRIQRKLQKDEAFEVITPTCIMGVRGTEFVVRVQGSDSELFVYEGTVSVALKSRPDQSLDVSQNQRVTIPWGTTTLEGLGPVPMDPSMTPKMAMARPSQGDDPEIYRADKPYVDPSTGHTYARIDRDMTYEAAKAYCEALGGHLMTITSAEEQAMAEALMYKGQKFWYLVGLAQRPGSVEPNQGFEWVTGEPLTFTRWHRENGVETEPSDRSGTGNHEDFVVLLNYAGDSVWKFGDWNDMNLGEKLGEYGFLCEWESVEDLRLDAELEDSNFAPKAITYDYFKTIALKADILDIQKDLGQGLKVAENSGGDVRTRWIFQGDNASIFCLTRPGASGADIIYFIGQENLSPPIGQSGLGTTDLALDLPTSRGNLNGIKSLGEAIALLGNEGLLTSRLWQDNEAFEFYEWRDAKGFGYQLSLNITQNTVTNSFKNPK